MGSGTSIIVRDQKKKIKNAENICWNLIIFIFSDFNYILRFLTQINRTKEKMQKILVGIK